jgi:hypothetical protein
MGRWELWNGWSSEKNLPAATFDPVFKGLTRECRPQNASHDLIYLEDWTLVSLKSWLNQMLLLLEGTAEIAERITDRAR